VFAFWQNVSHHLHNLHIYKKLLHFYKRFVSLTQEIFLLKGHNPFRLQSKIYNVIVKNIMSLFFLLTLNIVN